MNAQALFQAGRLADAIEAMNAEVRSSPADPDKRGFLADLLCIAGNFERADTQLDAITKVLPGAVAAIALTRQLVRAEQWRQQCFVEGRVPEFLGPPDERLQLHLRAMLLLREGDESGAAQLTRSAEELREHPRGTHAGQAFDEFRDCDDLCASFFEVLTSTGKYFWIPMERVKRLEPKPIERARDLLWQRARMEVDGGPDGEVFLPGIYAPTPTDATEQLGRVTEWTDAEPIRGRGQRTFLVGEEPLTLRELGDLVFEAAEA